MSYLTTPYPCNRGIPGNNQPTLHRFEANQHGTVCVYCGEKPVGKSLGERLRAAE